MTKEASSFESHTVSLKNAADSVLKRVNGAWHVFASGEAFLFYCFMSQGGIGCYLHLCLVSTVK